MAKIELENVSLTFALRKATRVSLKEFLVNGMFRESRNPMMRVPALVDLTLTAGDGDRIGVIGHNGAGKSTLLKMLAGVYPPTAGRRTVEGKICSLFDIALGFEPDATGRENIRYRAYLQGETPRTLKKKQAEIEEFSDLGEFLDTPVRYYSAGMSVRLAFSIATAVEPEVLLIDEVLSVGDLAFQMKAKDRMRKMMDRANLMVMVSHDMKSIAGLCTRVLWMEQGRVRMSGPADAVVNAYEDSVGPPFVGASVAAEALAAASAA